MKDKTPAKKIKELRNRKGLTQEELSEKSGLSLHTIQRIENGETEPRGDSITRLAAVFNVTPDEIIDWQIVEDNTVINLLNLTQFSFLAFPFLGVIVPLVIWIAQKDKIKNVDKIGKAIINFQITWLIAVFGTYIIWISIGMMHLNIKLHLFRLGPAGFVIILYAINILIITFNSIRAYQLKDVFYKPAFRILR